ncbi:hypothetical protein REPUB_Repub18cG0020300 [Reevesia pubescens]
MGCCVRNFIDWNSQLLIQVKFVFEAFKKLRPGIPLKCLHGRMNQEKRMGIYFQFCESHSVLFSTDVASRGLDFNKAVDWVVQEMLHPIYTELAALLAIFREEEHPYMMKSSATCHLYVNLTVMILISQANTKRPATRVLKKKKLKINVHRPVGQGWSLMRKATQTPFAMLADKKSGNILLEQDKKDEYYKKMREELKQVDKEEDENDVSGSEGESDTNRRRKRSKAYFHSDSDDGEREENKADASINADSISVAEQEELALNLLNSMQS